MSTIAKLDKRLADKHGYFMHPHIDEYKKYLEATPISTVFPTDTLSAPAEVLLEVLPNPRMYNGYEMNPRDVDTLRKLAGECFFRDLPLTLFGSRLVQDINPVDWDFLVPVFDRVLKEDLAIFAMSLGFDYGGSPVGLRPLDFVSMKLGNINLVMVTDKSFYEETIKAAEFVRDAQLKKKSERVAIHEYLRKEPRRISDEDAAALATGKPYSRDLVKKYGHLDK
jgi:hypothetical protein